MNRARIRQSVPSSEPTANGAGRPEASSSEQGDALEDFPRQERDRIATLLHDQVLQTFGLCLLKAQICEKLLQQQSYDRADQELGILQERLNQAIEQVRDIMAELKQHG